MTRFKVIAMATLFIGIILFFPLSYAAATAREVVLFRDTAIITETKKIRLTPAGGHLKRGLFRLSGAADPLSLIVSLTKESRLKIEDIAWQSAGPHGEDKQKKLRKYIQGAREEKAGLRGNIQALDAQILFWQTQAKGRARKTTEAGDMAATIMRNMRKAVREKLILEPQLEKINNRLKQLEAELKKIMEPTERPWLVTLLLSGPPAKETTINFTYLANGCGWEPIYRLEAKLSQRILTLTRQALMWQHTGQDWQQVNLTLDAGHFRRDTGSSELPDWIIRSAVEPRPRKRPQGGAKGPLSPEGPSRGEVTLPAGARSDLGHVSLGLVSMASHVKRKATLREESWPVEFFHILKPRLSSLSVLVAQISLDEHREIPAGQALCLVDGAYFSKKIFAFTGQDGQITLGTDPLVRSITTYVSDKVENQYLPAGVRAYRLRWTTQILNDRSGPIRMRLEDRPPQIRDELVQTQISYDPPPDRESKTLLIWERDLRAAERKTYQAELLIKVPLNIDFLPETHK